MYESFYGLREKPFSLLPDPGFLFLSREHQQALTLLEYGLLNLSGFIVLTGEIGVGKTTLMRSLLERLDSSINVGLISHTHQSLGDLLDWICAAFDLKAGTTGKLDLYHSFVDFLIDQYAQGRRTLLIVDEAQNLDADKLEELRLLSNVNSGKDLVLQLMLLGQPQLRDLLHQPALQQFVQRVAASFHLGRLSAADTQNYIHHRLSVAGGQYEIFTAEACEAVHHYSNGVPRLINLICDTALVYGYGAGSRIITDEIVDEFAESRAVHLLTPLEPRKQPRRPRTEQTLENASDVGDRAADGQSNNAVTRVPPTDTQSTSHMRESPEKPSDRAGSRADRRFILWALGLVVSLLLLDMGLGLVWYGTADRGVSPRSLTGKMTRSVDVESPTREGQEEMRSQIADAQGDVATPPQPRSAGSEPSKQAPAPTDRPNPTDDVSIPATSTRQPPAAGPAALPAPARPGQDLHPASPTAPEPSERTATEPEERRASSDQALSIANDTLSAASSVNVRRSHDTTDQRMTELEHELHELAISVERVGSNHLIADLGEKVQFPDGSVALDSDSQAFLEALALRLKMPPPIQVHVVGHTDHRGAAAVNLRLSERRAEAVALFLKGKGISEDYLSSEGKGETAPRVELRQEWMLGPAANRRIELELVQHADGGPKSN